MRFIAFQLALLTFLSISACGQDYLVLSTGDTLRGTVKPLPSDKLDQVQVTINKKKKVYKATQVRTMYFKGEIYNPYGLETSIRFMKLLKPGYLSLYAFRMDNQNTYDGRYLVRKDGQSMEVPNLAFKKSMITFLEDSPEVASKVKSGKYGRNDLNQIIDEFNAAIDANTTAQKSLVKITQKSKTQLQLLDTLKKNVEAQPEFASRKDALDLIADMQSKLERGETLSNYLLTGLKGYLDPVEAVKPDLLRFLDAVKE